MKISRRSLLGFLAGGPFVGAVMAKAHADPVMFDPGRLYWTGSLTSSKKLPPGVVVEVAEPGQPHQWGPMVDWCTACGRSKQEIVEHNLAECDRSLMA